MLSGRSVSVVLLAGGASRRMGKNKLSIEFGEVNPIELCVEAFRFCADEFVFVCSDENMTVAENAAISIDVPVKFVHGGMRRQDSVRNGVKASSMQFVSIHDCARCLVDRSTIENSLIGAFEHGSGIASVKVVDTIRNRDTGVVVERERLIAAQTPQSFERNELLDAFDRCNFVQKTYTDDAAILLASGKMPNFTCGHSMNMKLTSPDDIELFNAILERRKSV